VLDATIRLAHDLGLAVIGQGVERPQQARRLGELGCDAVQGHLIAHPLSAPDALDVLDGRIAR
jgi:EAL domain-containing protein (putative c-di-GMP-specific phosphodiesterase class I)